MTESNETRRLRRCGVATYLVRANDAGFEVLLVRRAGPRFFGEWFPVEGFVELGESNEEAALREIREETSLEPLSFYREQIDAVWSQVNIPIYVFVAFVAADSAVRLNYEHTEYEWLTPEEAIGRLPLKEQREALERITRNFLGQQPPEQLRVIG